MTVVSGKQRRWEFLGCFFFFFPGCLKTEEDWPPWPDGVFEKLFSLFVVPYVSARTVAASFYCHSFKGEVYILSWTLALLIYAGCTVGRRWSGGRFREAERNHETAVGLRTKKNTSCQIITSPPSLKVCVFETDDSITAATAKPAASIELKKKGEEGKKKKKTLNNGSTFKSIHLKKQCQQTAGRLRSLLLVMTKLNSLLLGLVMMYVCQCCRKE